MSLIEPLPKVYTPRCLVVVRPLYDNQFDGVVPDAGWAVPPLEAEVWRNSARKADRAKVTLDYGDLPIDPRAMKAIHFAVHIEDALDPRLPMVPTPLNLVFQGLADEVSARLSGNHHTVTFSGRDYTGLFLSRSWRSAALRIPMPDGSVRTEIPTPVGTTLHAFVELIRTGVAPKTLPTLWADPAAATTPLALFFEKPVYTPKKNENAWDVLVGMLDRFAMIPVWELREAGPQLVVRPAAGIGARQATMLYGENVSVLEFSRNLQKPQDKQVKITAWNPHLATALSASWPPTPVAGGEDLGTQGTPATNRGPTVKQVLYSVQGPYTPPLLLTLAKRVHREMSQHALKGRLRTREMRDLTGAVSLLDLANSDRIVVTLGPQNRADISGMSQAEAVAFLSDPLRANAINPSAATALVSMWAAANSFSSIFYVDEVHHRFSQDDGYEAEIGFLDFVLGV